MTTERQKEANKENALLSTGPLTGEGKAVVSKNAIKHGIFTKDLVIEKGDGKESMEEYQEILNNLTDNLNPKGQFQYLLTEKIAVDFWRLRRVLRYETGSIRKDLDMAIYDYYHRDSTFGKDKVKTNEEYDDEIKQEKRNIKWNSRYIKCLKKGVVSFDKEIWEGEGLESNVEDDLYVVLEAIGEDILSEEEYSRFEDGELSFEEVKTAFQRADYKDEDISKKLIECLVNQNKGLKEQIEDIKLKKQKNKMIEEVRIKNRSIADDRSVEKVIRYEKALQKSIYQNLSVLKKLQAISD